MSRSLPRPHRHAGRAAARVGPVGGADRGVRRAWPSGSATGWSTGRCSRTSASSSGSATAPTSSARRCTTSRTRAAATWRCAPRPPPRWSGPTCSTGRRRRGRSGTSTPTFRYERPQAGRFRQHHQLGVEALGAADPDVDVEVIALADDLPRRARPAAVAPRAQLDGHARRPGAATPTQLQALAARPARRPGEGRPGQGRDAPAAGPRLASGPRRQARRGRRAPHRRRARRGVAAHFDRVQAGLTALGIPFTIETRPGPRPRLLHAHHCSSSRARRSTPRRSRSSAAAATTGWSSSSAGRRRPASASARASSACCWRATPRACSPAPATSLDVFVVDVTGGGAARDLTAELRARRPARPTGPSTAGR